MGALGTSVSCYEKRSATLPLLPTKAIRFNRHRCGHPVEPNLRLRMTGRDARRIGISCPGHGV